MREDKTETNEREKINGEKFEHKKKNSNIVLSVNGGCFNP